MSDRVTTIRDQVLEIIREELNFPSRHVPRIESTWDDIGCEDESLGCICNQISVELGVSLEVWELTQARTLEGLYQLVEQRVAQCGS